MRMLAPLLFCFAFFSCGNHSQSNSSEQERYDRMMDSCRQAMRADSVQRALTFPSNGYSFDSAYHAEFAAEVQRYDTVTPNRNFIKHYIDSLDNVYVYWGSNSNGIIDTMPDVSGGWAGPCAIYLGETANYLAVKSQGLGYISVWLLPLNAKDTVSAFTGVIDIDFDNSLVLNPGGEGLLTMTNFESGRHVTFAPESLHAGMYGLYEIDSVSFRPDAVYLEWTGEDEQKHSLLQTLKD